MITKPINKILVIAEARVGGYYFTESLANEYGLVFHHEPSYPGAFNRIVNSTSMICTKLYIGSVIRHYETLTMSLEEKISHLCEVIRGHGFDKIFILDRRNEKEHIESMVHMWIITKNMKSDWKDGDKLQLLLTESRVNELKKSKFKHGLYLKMISDILNIPVIYYEDLYYNTDLVDLQGCVFVPDLTKKLRKEDTPKTLL
jgi:hypothetical protein